MPPSQAKQNGKPSFRQRQRDLRHTAIVEAAFELMATKGYRAMAIDDVIEEVGISRPTFYTHFVSKEQLGVEVIIKMISYARDHLKQFIAESPGRDAAMAMIRFTLERRFPENNFDYNASNELQDHPDVIEAEEQLVSELAEQIVIAQKNGNARQDVSPIMAAHTLHAILKDPLINAQCSAGHVQPEKLIADVTTLLLGNAEGCPASEH